MQSPIILGRINYTDSFYIMKTFNNINYMLCSYYTNFSINNTSLHTGVFIPTNTTTIYYCWVNSTLSNNYNFLYNTFICYGQQNQLYFQDNTIGNYLGMGDNNSLVNSSLPYIFYLNNEYSEIPNYLFSSVNYNVYSGYQQSFNILYVTNSIYTTLPTFNYPVPCDFRTIFFLPVSWYSNCQYTGISQNNTIAYFLEPNVNNIYGPYGFINYDYCNKSLLNNFTYCTGDNICGTNNCYGICNGNNDCVVNNANDPFNTTLICNNLIPHQIQITFDYYIALILVILILILILGIYLVKKSKNKTNSNYNKQSYINYISSDAYYK